MEQDIFRKGSTTYYWSSLFFPKDVREDVFRFYSFVRVVDDYVDQITPNKKAYSAIKQAWRDASVLRNFDTTPIDGDGINERVIKNIIHICKKYDCDKEWVQSFFASMDMDMRKRRYTNIDQTIEYIYGSAEVIGLFMARIMGLDPTADEFARLQGRAMQFVNFIRDIAEDNDLGRLYFPREDLAQHGLRDLSETECRGKPEQFANFMRLQVDRYESWQATAREGFPYIPHRLRIPLRTAVGMYDWTAKQIANDPFIVFSIKVKPSKYRVLYQALRSALLP